VRLSSQNVNMFVAIKSLRLRVWAFFFCQKLCFSFYCKEWFISCSGKTSRFSGVRKMTIELDKTHLEVTHTEVT
jgi:hypothetical protein